MGSSHAGNFLCCRGRLEDALKIPTATTIERLPSWVRALLGCAVALLSVVLTYAIPPLRAIPLLVAFPTVVLSAWFFGLSGSLGCALVEVVLVDALLTKAQFRFSIGFAREDERLAMFLVLSTLVGVSIRRLADKRAEVTNKELKRSLILEQTQRQMAEERARAGEALRDRDALLKIALEANGMGLWVWDLVTDEVERSDEVYRMAGCEPGAFGPERGPWMQYVYSDDRAGLNEAFERVRATGEDFHHQYRVQWPDGSLRWLESQGKSQRDADGRARRVVGVIADVTHRKRAEEAMLRAEKLAVAGRLAASVAHEINNPLEAVANLLYLVTLASTAEEAHAHALIALDELLRVSLITQSTLKFHRQPGAPKITMLSEVLEGVVAMFRPRLNATGIALDVRAQSETAIACMPSEAQQIFANLMANAIEAMPRSGRLVIRLRPSRDWRDRGVEGMRATICDSGSGMDRATRERIFEPFFTTKPETGTGLGMWVVAQLVERHGGHIRVWSSQRPGASGTGFSIFLPMAHPMAGDGVDAELDVDPLALDPTASN